MKNSEQIIKELIELTTNFTSEYNFNEGINKLELREIPDNEIEKLGEEKALDNFRNGIFKIKLPNNQIIDYTSIAEHCKKNNIKGDTIILNSNFKYLRWELTEDLTTPQIKKQIKNRLLCTNDIDYEEITKYLIKEDVAKKKIEGYINGLPIKTSLVVKENCFYIQTTTTSENAVKIINEVVEELKSEEKNFIKCKISRDKRNTCFYVLFIIIITCLWFLNKNHKIISQWISIIIEIILFLTPLVVMRLINYSFIDSVIHRAKAEQKYKNVFNNKEK